MGSVISTLPNRKKNIRTLNLTLIGCGDRNAVLDMLHCAKNALVAYAKSLPIYLYSDTALDRAEAKSELLFCKRFPMIRISNGDFEKDFYGFADYIDYSDLYNYLYKSPSQAAEWQHVDYYSPKGLSNIIHDRFSGPDEDLEETFCDFHLRLAHTLRDNQKSFARIECQISEPLMGEEISTHVEKLKEMIRSLDSGCSDGFHSAYLSFNYPELAIVHNKLYPVFDEELCDQYLLGAEWCVYSCRSIDLDMGDKDRDQLSSVMEGEPLTSGTLHTAKCSITDFTPHIRKKLYAIFQKQLVPAYGIYSWSQLHRLSWSSSCLPEQILVFRNPFQTTDPDIALSFHYNPQKMMQRAGLKEDLLINGFCSK